MRKNTIYAISVVFACIFIFVAIRSAVVKAQTPVPETIYTSVKIEYGDTLEDIERRYNNRDIMKKNKYIFEVARLNRINKDHITGGAYLIVPTWE